MLTEIITAEIRSDQLTKVVDHAIERLTEELKQGHTEEYLNFLAFWSKFHRYSSVNVMLILAQRPEASQVAGYTTWKRMGRQVRQGAKSIWIWRPIIRKISDEQTGLPIDYCVGFTPAPVFDAADLVDIATNPLPTLWSHLPDDAHRLGGYVASRIEEAGFVIEERPLPIGRQGSVNPYKRITLSDSLDSRTRVMVLLHELAHGLEHFREERTHDHRAQQELEAESASAVVCAMLGLEHPVARDYLLSYHVTATELKASLGAVKRIVGQMVVILGLDEAAQETALAPTG
jgi:N-terminal domain of anti-restriction factor ArdC